MTNAPTPAPTPQNVLGGIGPSFAAHNLWGNVIVLLILGVFDRFCSSSKARYV